MAGDANQMSTDGSTKAIFAALGANTAIAVGKFVAAFFTGSAATLAEAAHSTADCLNQVFLLVGIRGSLRPADEKHPFGYGKVRYFWSFIVAMTIFSIGATFSIYEGVHKIFSLPEAPRGTIWWSYGVLGGAIVLESYSCYVAYREFSKVRRGRTLRAMVHDARDPVLITVLLEDAAALVGLTIALLGVWLGQLTHNHLWDGLASIVVGVVLLGVAYILAYETRALLIGEAATKDDQVKIRAAVKSHPSVEGVVSLRTAHFGGDDLLVAIEIDFLDHLSLAQLEEAVDAIEDEIRKTVPVAKKIYVEARRPHIVAIRPRARGA